MSRQRVCVERSSEISIAQHAVRFTQNPLTAAPTAPHLLDNAADLEEGSARRRVDFHGVVVVGHHQLVHLQFTKSIVWHAYQRGKSSDT